MIKFCKKCLNPDTRPNAIFDEEGVCPVCRYEEDKKKNAVDWDARRREIEEICEWGKANSKNSYDCIVTVSGGKDSTRQALFARDDLKLNPLLVSSVYPPEQLHERGAQNLSNLISLGFDTISLSLNPQVWKKLMRQGFFMHANWCKSTEMALYSIPVHVAIAYKIPLIFLGENPALTIGEKHGSLDGDASSMKNCHTLQGGDPENFQVDGITAKDTYFYKYPPDEDMEYAKLRLIYLGYYIEDWSGYNNGRFSVEHGLKTREEPPEKIGDLWGISALDEDFRIVNQFVKYVKFGFGHVTDQVCEAINAGRINREEAISLVKKYDGKCDRSYIEKYCRYLGIPEEKFWEIVESVRNRDIWEKDKDNNWKLKADYK